MKDFSFKIKVSDILLNPGSKDYLIFEKKFSNQIPNIDSNGISGKIEIQGLDENSISITILELKVNILENCDICNGDIIRNVILNDYGAIFTTKGFKREGDEYEEFFISNKDQSINIEDLICQAINLQSPIVKKCDTCINNSINLLDDIDEQNIGNNIIWN